MGKKVSVFDDLDPALDADETVIFSVGNNQYEIDLNQKNIDKLHEVLAPFIDAARKAPRPHLARPPQRRHSNPELDAIRHWASKNGFAVSDKGRIPLEVESAYRKAHEPKTNVSGVPAAVFSG
jgi:hypothetical protein